MRDLRAVEQAMTLLNTALPDEAALVSALPGRPDLHPRVTDRDCIRLRLLQRDLATLFEPDADVVEALNRLLAAHPLIARIERDRGGALELAVTATSGGVADLLIAESLMGLARVVARLGPDRLGRCAAPGCDRAWVDTSPALTRRYCSERCATRANVAAHRARRRAARSSMLRPPP